MARRQADPTPARSEPPHSALPTPHSGIPPPDLDRALEQVIQRPEFNWRLPRDKRAENESKQGIFASFMESALKTIRGWGRAVARWLKAALHWIANVIDWLREKILGKRATAREDASTGAEWMVFLQALIFVLLVLAAGAVAILFYRTWGRPGTRQETAGEVIAPLPDLSGENITASQLPEDGWLALARDLMSKGEPRLALRALYLASLAHLAQRELISVAKFKSNRDYERELRRRAGRRPDLQAAFAENVGIFDDAWYGLHEVTQEAIGRFQINLEKIRTC